MAISCNFLFFFCKNVQQYISFFPHDYALLQAFVCFLENMCVHISSICSLHEHIAHLRKLLVLTQPSMPEKLNKTETVNHVQEIHSEALANFKIQQ